VAVYALIVSLRFVLPGALLCCGLLAMRGVAPWMRRTGLVLLGLGAVVIVLAVWGTGVDDLIPYFAAPALIAAAIVLPLAGIALMRSSTSPVGRLGSAHAVSTLVILAAVIQFITPWLLVSGE
jgi:hypothetical protein